MLEPESHPKRLLLDVLQPPALDAIDAAMQQLAWCGATERVDGTGPVTELGKLLSHLQKVGSRP